MHKRMYSVVLVGLFSMVVACGGGAAVEPAAEPMEHAEPAPAEEAPATQTPAMLGGGTATEVHPGMAGSPHVKVDWEVNGGNISITYGRPLLKGRVVGESVEPMADKFWRFGADEATTLVTDRDLMLGDSHIPAGEYTLWTMHMNDEFHLIVNSETGQWGTAYDSSHDVAHIPMEVGELDPPADQLTISIGDGTLGFGWGQMTASVPLTVH